MVFHKLRLHSLISLHLDRDSIIFQSLTLCTGYGGSHPSPGGVCLWLVQHSFRQLSHGLSHRYSIPLLPRGGDHPPPERSGPPGSSGKVHWAIQKPNKVF